MDCRGSQTPVRDQGARSTCVAFAVSAAHEWRSGRIDHLSAEHAFALAKARDGLAGDVGTTVQACIKGIIDEGQSPESDWPYGDPAWPDRRSSASLPTSRRSFLSATPLSGDLLPVSIQSTLKAGSRVVLTLKFVPNAWMNAWRGGIVDVAGQQVVRGQHAVLLVGYVTRAKNLYFIIKNSWGTGWGDAGFGYISYDYVSRHATAAHAL